MGENRVVVPEGWQEVTPPEHPRVFAATHGLDKSGKTDFALQFPKPLAFVPLDRPRTEGKDPKRMFPEGVVEPKNPSAPHLPPFRFDPRRPAEDQISDIWPRLEDAILGAIEERSFRTLVIDTGSQLWEMVRLHKLGKLSQVMPEKYMEPNQLFRSIIEAAQDRTDLNFIMTHKVKKEYVDRGSGRGNWNGQYERSGFNDIGFMVEHVLLHEKITDEEGMHLGFRIIVQESVTPEAKGITFGPEEDDDFDLEFSRVARVLVPSSKKGDWE